MTLGVLMDRLLLYLNNDKNEKLQKAYEIADVLESIGYNVFLMINNKTEKTTTKYKELKNMDEILEKNIDLTICLGGDGNLIGYVRKFSHSKIPLVGLNLGNLGFLTELSMQNYERIFRELKEKKRNYHIQERVGIYIEYTSGSDEQKRFFAINDVSIERGARSKLLDVELYINGIFVDTYIGDGILVATATGSTAYNLSAGGPILLPTSTELVISPICSHSLRARPIVVTKDDIITLKIVSNITAKDEIPSMIVDGQNSCPLGSEAFLNVKVRNETIKFLIFDQENFFRKLREKIR